jgi:GTP-binding protein
MSGFEGRNPYDDYITIKNELKEFNEKLVNKEEVIIANKMDMDSSKENLKEFKKKVKDVKIFEVTALIGEGLDDVMDYLGNKLDEIKEEKLVDDESTESFVLYKFKKEVPFTIEKENDVYVVKGKEVERLLEMARFGTDEAERRFANKLRKMGIDDELVKMGIEEGDKVRILDTEFEFK